MRLSASAAVEGFASASWRAGLGLTPRPLSTSPRRVYWHRGTNTGSRSSSSNLVQGSTPSQYMRVSHHQSSLTAFVEFPAAWCAWPRNMRPPELFCHVLPRAPESSLHKCRVSGFEPVRTQLLKDAPSLQVTLSSLLLHSRARCWRLVQLQKQRWVLDLGQEGRQVTAIEYFSGDT
jgi:hypothetical protein